MDLTRDARLLKLRHLLPWLGLVVFGFILCVWWAQRASAGTPPVVPPVVNTVTPVAKQAVTPVVAPAANAGAAVANTIAPVAKQVGTGRAPCG